MNRAGIAGYCRDKCPKSIQEEKVTFAEQGDFFFSGAGNLISVADL